MSHSAVILFLSEVVLGLEPCSARSLLCTGVSSWPRDTASQRRYKPSPPPPPAAHDIVKVFICVGEQAEELGSEDVGQTSELEPEVQASRSRP